MAGTSPPRRSSRARLTQSQSQHSSTSSSLSGRPERSTRLSKIEKYTPTGSLSDELPDESTDDTSNNRRRTRGQEEERERAQSKAETIKMTTEADEVQDEDEAVRCICGFDDYPGLPPIVDDAKHSPKDTTIDIDPPLPSEINEDIAGLFVQCDICKVWQHGACVGIMSDDAVTDEYFCESCRKDLHKICTASNGQRYSHYLPLSRISRNTSRAGSSVKDGTRSRSPRSKEGRETRNGRQSSVNQTSKRRSTMNSRDAAYDEDEQLRRAIEASKEDAIPEDGETGVRRTKRGRSDSEEKLESAKRRRTSSRSTSPVDDKAQLANREESEEPSSTRNASKKSRSATTRNQKDQKEKAEREERDRQRAEAASKRKGRAERRRADGSTPASTILVGGSEAHQDTDSDPSEELPLAAARAATNRTVTVEKLATAVVVETKAEIAPPPEAPPSSQPSPDTPSVVAVAQSTSKSKRSHQKKGKGRNQYTKDRDLHDDASPPRSQSRDVQGHDNGHPTHGKHGESSAKSHPRSKGGFNSKVSITDMKRRAAAMFDFISRTQLELAGETTPPSQESRRASDNALPQIAADGNASGQKRPPDIIGEPNTITNQTDAPKDFKELTCVEMMDDLTRDLVKWQKEFLA